MTSNLDKAIAHFNRGEYEPAFELLLPLAKKGNCQAQCYVGTAYQCGLGVPVDGLMAVKWYLQAAEQGVLEDHLSATAYNNLSQLFSTGSEKLVPDMKMASDYSKKARDLGFEM